MPLPNRHLFEGAGGARRGMAGGGEEGAGEEGGSGRGRGEDSLQSFLRSLALPVRFLSKVHFSAVVVFSWTVWAASAAHDRSWSVGGGGEEVCVRVREFYTPCDGNHNRRERVSKMKP